MIQQHPPVRGITPLQGLRPNLYRETNQAEKRGTGRLCLRHLPSVCRGYHRNGKSYCSSHRIHEEVLDAEVQACAETVREQCAEEVEKLAQLQKMWALRKPILDAHILSLQKKVQELEREIDEIVMEKIIKSENTIKAPLAR